MKECALCSRCLDDGDAACPEDGCATAREGLPGPRVIDGTYELERRLGEGGMGVVFRARHATIGRSFAVKLIRGTSALAPQFLSRFRTEAVALGRLKHPGIVDVTDFGVDPRAGGVPYLVMELLDGVSLDVYCDRVGRLPVAEALQVLDGMAEAVDFAHAQGVLHRDLKPSNVLLATNGAGGWRVKLLDFGLALLDPEALGPGPADGAPPSPPAIPLRGPASSVPAPTPQAAEHETVTVARKDAGVEDSSAETGLLGTQLATGFVGSSTRPGDLVGTPVFMAPERFRGALATRASDIYALGVIAFQLLTGRTPFSGSLGAVARGHLEEDPPRPSSLRHDLPTGVDAALLGALAKRPDQRPSTARGFVEALQQAARAEELRSWRRRQTPRRLAAGLALGLLAAALLSPASALRPIADLERAAIDARFASARPRPLDPRILVVLLDEASLARERRALGDMADVVAEALQRAFAAGARVVAVDLLLPASWGRSGPFVQLVVGHADRLVLAAHATADGVVGPEALSGLATAALGDAAAGGMFGLVNLEEDADGVVRRGRLRFATRDGGAVESWAAAAVRAFGDDPRAERAGDAVGPRPAAAHTFVLDFTAVQATSAVVGWSELDERLARDPSLVRGKLIVLGAQLAATGDDALRVPRGPGSPATLPGAMIQARAIDTILAGFPIREPWGPIPPLALALVVAATAVGLLVTGSLGWSLVGATAVAGLHVLLAWVAFRYGGHLVPIAAPLALFVLGLAMTVALRRWAFPPAPSGGSR